MLRGVAAQITAALRTRLSCISTDYVMGHTLAVPGQIDATDVTPHLDAHAGRAGVWCARDLKIHDIGFDRLYFMAASTDELENFAILVLPYDAPTYFPFNGLTIRNVIS